MRSNVFLLRRQLRFIAAEAVALWKEEYFSDSRFKKSSRYWMRVGQNYLESLHYHLRKPNYVSTDQIDYRINQNPNEAVERLNAYGIAFLPKMDVADFEFVTINNSNKISGAAHAIDCAQAEAFCNKVGFHKIAAQYLRVKECHFFPRAWRINANPEKACMLGTSQWHRDRDGTQVVKFFVYLSDVMAGDGEHEYSPGTHKIKPLRFVPQVRYSEEEVRSRYKTIKVLGEKGTCFVEDTTALHKGSVPINSNRDMIAFSYFTGPVYWDKGTIKIQF